MNKSLVFATKVIQLKQLWIEVELIEINSKKP